MTTTAVPRDKQTLLDKADACDRQAAALDPEQPGADRAREMLTTAAAHLRRAATVYDLDPTLADEPHGVRDVDLLVEFGRQMPPLLRNCLSEKNLDRWPRQGRWDEAEALFARLGGAAGRLIREVPRRDHATVEGSQAISRGRLAGNAYLLRRAAEMIRHALEPASKRLPHQAPEVAELARLAAEVDRVAASLEPEEGKEEAGS